MSKQPRCSKCKKLVGLEARRRGLCGDCERQARGLDSDAASSPAPSMAPAASAGVLDMWCIYGSPKDYPGKFVVRRWSVLPAAPPLPARPSPDQDCKVFDTLDQARDFVPQGYFRIGRADHDDSCIVETWL